MTNGLTFGRKSGILNRMNVNWYDSYRLTFGWEVWKLNGFLQLVKALAAYNDGMFDGYVIAKVLWNVSGEYAYVETAMIKQKPGYAVIRVTGRNQDKNETGFLQITLWKPGEVSKKCPEQEGTPCDLVQRMPEDHLDADGTITIAQEQVDHYLNLVQDTNPIHRGRNAIVPGLYVLYELQRRKALQEFFTEHASYETAFHQPLPVGVCCRIEAKDDGVRLVVTDTTYFTIHKRVE